MGLYVNWETFIIKPEDWSQMYIQLGFKLALFKSMQNVDENIADLIQKDEFISGIFKGFPEYFSTKKPEFPFKTEDDFKQIYSNHDISQNKKWRKFTGDDFDSFSYKLMSNLRFPYLYFLDDEVISLRVKKEIAPPASIVRVFFSRKFQYEMNNCKDLMIVLYEGIKFYVIGSLYEYNERHLTGILLIPSHFFDKYLTI